MSHDRPAVMSEEGLLCMSHDRAGRTGGVGAEEGGGCGRREREEEGSEGDGRTGGVGAEEGGGCGRRESEEEGSEGDGRTRGVGAEEGDGCGRREREEEGSEGDGRTAYRDSWWDWKGKVEVEVE